MSKELFYTEKDKKLFLIVGYDNPLNVDGLIQTLEKGKAKLLSYLPKETKRKVRAERKVSTDVIQSSRRYKYMRVFFTDVEVKDVPKEAFFIEIKTKHPHNEKEKIGLDSQYQWDMWKWLRD